MRQTFASFALTSFAFPATLPSCAAERPLVDHALVEHVTTRGSSEALLREALDSAAVEGLDIEPYVRDRRDPSTLGFWRACAWAYSLRCAEARQTFYAERARRGSRGLPGPIQTSGSARGGDEDVEAGVMATLDILGLLGVGPAAAESDLADAQVRAAFGEVERVAWASMHEVERAYARVAAARARVARLATLVTQAREDRRRIAILAEHGWRPIGELSAAESMIRRAEIRLTASSGDLADRVRELSSASGLAPTSGAFDAVSASMLDTFDTADLPTAVPEPAHLLSRVPRLRARRLDYATAEAAVRRAAAEAWPTLRVGPSLRVDPDPFLVGGVVNLSLPWPGSVRGEVAAAAERRALARIALEDALRDVMADATASRARLDLAIERARNYAGPTEIGAAAAWRASRARFRVDDAALPQWTDQLERSIEVTTATVDAEEAMALAWIDLREVIGPTRSEVTP